MLNRATHESAMTSILTEIYSDPLLRTNLAFKGGTAAYLFYDLPRFSTDLDFDLIDPKKSEQIYPIVKKIAEKSGRIKDETIKEKTVYFRLSYEHEAPTVKIEISRIVNKEDEYEVKELFGLPVLVMTKPCMAANKFVAVLDRKKMVNRDWFDCWFFLEKHWPIKSSVIESRTGMSAFEYFVKMKEFLERNMDSINILHGMGEVLDAEQKVFVKNRMLDDILFWLRFRTEKQGRIDEK